MRFVCHADYATHNGLDLRRGEKCSFSIILYAVEEEKRGSVISARNSTVGHNKREKEISRLYLSFVETERALEMQYAEAEPA